MRKFAILVLLGLAVACGGSQRPATSNNEAYETFNEDEYGRANHSPAGSETAPAGYYGVGQRGTPRERRPAEPVRR